MVLISNYIDHHIYSDQDKDQDQDNESVPSNNINHPTPSEQLFITYMQLLQKHGGYIKQWRNQDTGDLIVQYGINNTNLSGTMATMSYSNIQIHSGFDVLDHMDHDDRELITKIYNAIKDDYDEQLRIEEQLFEEEVQRKKDELFMARIKELMPEEKKKNGEFDETFKLLEKLESLGKKQESLLHTWKENNDQIYTLRDQLYSLPK